ncbi:YcxB family protein [Chloroflexia bacterium SDU3-3]|nr:YcxB family protein [Chloroflexia bacterium SDU3-3]
MQPLTIRAGWTEEDLIETLRDVRSLSRPRIIMKYVGGVLLLMCGVLFLLLGAMQSLYYGSLMVACFLFAALLLLDAPISLWRLRQNLRANPDMQQPMVISFDEHGMTIHQRKIEQRIDWKMFSRFHDLPRCFVLASKSHRYTLPKRWLSPAEQDELRAMVGERLPNKA